MSVEPWSGCRSSGGGPRNIARIWALRREQDTGKGRASVSNSSSSGSSRSRARGEWRDRLLRKTSSAHAVSMYGTCWKRNNSKLRYSSYLSLIILIRRSNISRSRFSWIYKNWFCKSVILKYTNYLDFFLNRILCSIYCGP